MKMLYSWHPCCWKVCWTELLLLMMSLVPACIDTNVGMNEGAVYLMALFGGWKISSPLVLFLFFLLYYISTLWFYMCACMLVEHQCRCLMQLSNYPIMWHRWGALVLSTSNVRTGKIWSHWLWLLVWAILKLPLLQTIVSWVFTWEVRGERSGWLKTTERLKLFTH